MSKQLKRFTLSRIKLSQDWRIILCSTSGRLFCLMLYTFKTFCHTHTKIFHPFGNIRFGASVVIIMHWA